MDRLVNSLRQSSLPTDLWSVNQTSNFVDIAGRRIWFKGADRPDNLYGEDVFAAVIDEAPRCRESVWIAIRSTLTATGGKAKLIGNVTGRNNWFYRQCRAAEQGAPDRAYFKLTAYDAVDAGIFPPDEIEDARQSMDERSFKMLYMAEVGADESNPFGVEAIIDCTVDGVSGEPAVIYGVDLARKHDYTVVCGIDARGAVCFLDRWRADWRQTQERILRLTGDAPAICDATGVGDPIVQELQRTRGGFEPFIFTQRNKQMIMQKLASVIQRNLIRFPKGWLTDELESFEIQDSVTQGVKYSAPNGMHDDGVCALAMAVYRWERMFVNPIKLVLERATLIY